jgi:hypothetical protein
MRPFMLGLMVGSYVGLGLYDLATHNPKQGAAALLLGVVNALLLGG